MVRVVELLLGKGEGDENAASTSANIVRNAIS